MGNCQTISEDGEKRISTKFGGKPQVYIKTLTWSRDSHGLFDYESKNLTKKNLKATHTGRLMRQGNDVRVAKENEKHLNKDEKELFKLMIKDGNVLVDNINEPKVQPTTFRGEENLENVDYDLWLVVKSLKTHASNKGYKLTEGDLIKLGRVKFRIRELKGLATKSSKCEKQTKIEDDNISLGESDKKSCATPRGSQASVAQTCRICLSESTEAGDPFFSPCNCTGTMRYIHVKCLQRWLKSKLHIKQSAGSTSVHWKTLECELCKTQYPTYFIVDDKRYDIVEFDRPDCPYIILDILTKEKCITRGIHVIKMENKTNIRLGRGHDSDIRITDISVSRCHAFIKLEKGEFFIEDNNSKFGTLVHLRKAFTIPIEVPDVSLQVGRTVVALTVKKGRKFLSSCFSSTTENHNNTSNDDRNSESGDGNDSNHLGQNDGDDSPSSRSPAIRSPNNRLQHSATLPHANAIQARGNADAEDDQLDLEFEEDENEEAAGEPQPVVAVQSAVVNSVINVNQQENNSNNGIINLPHFQSSLSVQAHAPNSVRAIQAAQSENQPAQNNEPAGDVDDNFNDCDGPVD